jgi:hypothetical protein
MLTLKSEIIKGNLKTDNSRNKINIIAGNYNQLRAEHI